MWNQLKPQPFLLAPDEQGSTLARARNQRTSQKGPAAANETVVMVPGFEDVSIKGEEEMFLLLPLVLRIC